MYRVFLQQRKLIVVESTEKEFRQKYPGPYELVQAVAEYDNLVKVIERLKKDYRAEEVINDYQELKRWGWKYFTEEIKKKWLEAKIGKPRPKESNAKVSAKMKGKSNFEGRRHKELTKIMIASHRYGKPSIQKGQRWCHHPETGAELRCFEEQKPTSFRWGRSPEFKDYINSTKRVRLLVDSEA
jgi:hypothetical protein